MSTDRLKARTIAGCKDSLNRWMNVDRGSREQVLSYPAMLGVVKSVLENEYMIPSERVKEALNFIKASEELRKIE